MYFELSKLCYIHFSFHFWRGACRWTVQCNKRNTSQQWTEEIAFPALKYIFTLQQERITKLLPLIICHQFDDVFPVFQTSLLALPVCVQCCSSQYVVSNTQSITFVRIFPGRHLRLVITNNL